MSVQKRHVLFLAGFDPKGAAYYHGLYQREAAKQAEVTPHQHYTVGPRQRSADGNHRWQVQAQDASTGETTETTVEHLRWDDLVRREWPKQAWQVAWGAILTYLHIFRLGRVFFRACRVTPRPLTALLWPGCLWLAVLALAVGAGQLLANLLASLFANHLQLVQQAQAGMHWSVWLAGAVGALLSGALLALAWRLEQQWNTTWLLRIYRFIDRWSEGHMPWLDQRLQAMSERLDEVLADPDVDEVLVVGYSVGSILAVSMIADRLAAVAASRARPLALLTLGQCVPFLGLLRGSAAFRQQLAQVADAPDLVWVDASSPTDWGSFALIDPVQQTLDRPGINPRAMVSPRFHTLFAPQRYRQLRRDKRRMHLQYLMAGERPGGYNFFDITAGPRRLMEHPWKSPSSAPQ
jgi:hypothetical protein